MTTSHTRKELMSGKKEDTRNVVWLIGTTDGTIFVFRDVIWMLSVKKSTKLDGSQEKWKN
jgi:hypothetical protein